MTSLQDAVAHLDIRPLSARSYSSSFGQCIVWNFTSEASGCAEHPVASLSLEARGNLVRLYSIGLGSRSKTGEEQTFTSELGLTKTSCRGDRRKGGPRKMPKLQLWACFIAYRNIFNTE